MTQSQSTEAPETPDPAAHAPFGARWMGYLGLLPFFAMALGVWIGPVGLADWLTAYGAVILSFVGAIHWGLAMGRGQSSPAIFQASVVPALVGWAALLVPRLIGLPVLALAFIGWRIWEHRCAAHAMPHWFRHLRTVLTAGAVIALLAGWVALLPFIGKG